MFPRSATRSLGLITVGAFWLAAGIYVWKAVVEGFAPLTVIAAVCFALGGAIRLCVLRRDWNRGDGRRTPETARGESEN